MLHARFNEDPDVPWKCELVLPGTLRQLGGLVELHIASLESAVLDDGGQPMPAGDTILLRFSARRPDGVRELQTWSLNPFKDPRQRGWLAVPVVLPARSASIVLEITPPPSDEVDPLQALRRLLSAQLGFVLLRTEATMPALGVRYFTDAVSYLFVAAVLLWAASGSTGLRGLIRRPASVSAAAPPTRTDGSTPDQAPSFRGRSMPDAALVLVLALSAGAATFAVAREFAPALPGKAWDAWFEADPSRVYNNMTDRRSDHYRTNVHPLFSVLSYPVVATLRHVFGVSAFASVVITLATVAALWTATVYILLRSIGAPVPDSLMFCLVATTSASAVFWFVIPETYSFGSLSILLPLLLVPVAENRALSPWWFVGASALSMAFTITNWTAGIVAAFVRLPAVRAISVTALAAAAYLVLWPIQRDCFTNARHVTAVDRERDHLICGDAGARLAAARSFAFHSMLMPRATVGGSRGGMMPVPGSPPIPLTQDSSPGSASIWGRVGVVAWTLLLATGLRGAIVARHQARFRIALALVLIGQFALHVLYGTETFLYSCHFGVLLVLLSAWGTFTRARLAALLLAAALVACNVLNNFPQLHRAMNQVLAGAQCA